MISSRKVIMLAAAVATFAAGLSWTGTNSLFETGFFSEAQARIGRPLTPMSYAGVERVITDTTRSTVGVAVSPHLFRTSIASSAAMHGGSNPHLASALLHHTDHSVTEAHYNRASSLSAAQSYQAIVQAYIKD